jgi:hypothetical protein
MNAMTTVKNTKIFGWIHLRWYPKSRSAVGNLSEKEFWSSLKMIIKEFSA